MSEQPDNGITKPASLPASLPTLVGPVAWIATLFVAIVVCSPAQAREGTAVNVGLEGGFSAAHSLPKNGGHMALRTSLISTEGSPMVADIPDSWFGGYVRFQRGLRGVRGAMGAGRSLGMPFLGLEGGLVVAHDEAGHPKVGAELTALITLGIVGVYVRESVVHRDSDRWQTDVGLRLNFPFFLLKSK